jgi:hypothetical protein
LALSVIRGYIHLSNIDSPKFGPFLDLFTGQRCCITCVINLDSLIAVPASAAKWAFGLNSKKMRTLSLPTLLSLPEQYAESGRRYGRRVSLVRVLSASAAQSMRHEGLNISGRRLRSLGRPLSQQPQIRSPQISPLSLQGMDGRGQNRYRFMPMLRIPTLDRRTGNLDWGVSCRACRFGPRDERRGYYDWQTVYSAAGYIEHFQKRQLSQIGRKEVPRHISHTEGNQCMADARFLGFLSNFKFDTVIP